MMHKYSRTTGRLRSPLWAGQSHMSKPYPNPRPRSGTTLVVLVGAGFKPALVQHSRCVRLIRAYIIISRTNFDSAADDGNSLAIGNQNAVLGGCRVGDILVWRAGSRFGHRYHV